MSAQGSPDLYWVLGLRGGNADELAGGGHADLDFIGVTLRQIVRQLDRLGRLVVLNGVRAGVLQDRGEVEHLTSGSVQRVACALYGTPRPQKTLQLRPCYRVRPMTRRLAVPASLDEFGVYTAQDDDTLPLVPGRFDSVNVTCSERKATP